MEHYHYESLMKHNQLFTNYQNYLFGKLIRKIRYCKDCQHFLDGEGYNDDFCTMKDTEVYFLDSACNNFLYKLDDKLLKSDNMEYNEKIDDKIVAPKVDIQEMLSQVALLKYMMLSERNFYDDMTCYETLENLEHNIKLLNNKDTSIEMMDWEL